MSGVTVPVLVSSPRLQRDDDHSCVVRSTANFHPTLWGDLFLTYSTTSTSDEDDTAACECKQREIEELKEEVRKELKGCSANNSVELLKLIDSIQLLGLAYHFEREIEAVLKEIYETYGHELQVDDDNEDLINASLRFRLLRQEGYPVSSDVFSKFKDKEGNFKESLVGDPYGMLALYEASHLMVPGEEILEEALAFTTTHLQFIVTDHPNNHLVKQVSHALKWPIRKGVTRVEARYYISIYPDLEGSCNKSLLKLAKLDFNLLQSLYGKELSEISMCWKSLDFARKLPFARDRLVESYFWALGVFLESQYILVRSFLTKVTTMMAIIDDMYDAYGTIEELETFTKAIERWDVSCIDQLPADYLKWVYQAVLDIYEEMEEKMAKQGKSYRVYYAKEAMKRQVQSYFVETKWLNQGYTPTFDVYLSNALVSSCHTLLIAICFVAMEDVVVEETFQWLLNRPKMIRASELIGRVMNDIVSHEFEQSRMHIPTSIVCYMKQYGVTKQEAYDALNKLVVNAWKDMNQESLTPTQVPLPVIVRVLNFNRVVNVVYKDADSYTHAEKLMKDLIALMLINPVQI